MFYSILLLICIYISLNKKYSGYWLCSFNLGLFVGPIVSGIVTTYWSFRSATAVAFGLTCFMILLNFTTASTRHRDEGTTDNDMHSSLDSGIESPKRNIGNNEK